MGDNSKIICELCYRGAPDTLFDAHMRTQQGHVCIACVARYKALQPGQPLAYARSGMYAYGKPDPREPKPADVYTITEEVRGEGAGAELIQVIWCNGERVGEVRQGDPMGFAAGAARLAVEAEGYGTPYQQGLKVKRIRKAMGYTYP